MSEVKDPQEQPVTPIGKVTETIMKNFSAAIPTVDLEAQHERLRREDEWRDRLQERRTRLERAGLEGTVTDEDFDRIVKDKLEDTQSLRLVRGWLKGKAPFLVLLGPAGRGKTVACAWAIAGVNGRYVTAKKLERMFLAQYGAILDEQDRLMWSRGLLVIDDVGIELKRDEFISSLYEVVNARQGGGRRTIITSNLSRKEFKQKYNDARLLSRLKRAEFGTDAGPDMRDKQ